MENSKGKLKIIGVIGTGIMGTPMVIHLMKAGFVVRIYARNKEKVMSLLNRGATVFNSVRECVAECDAVITMLGFPSDVEEIYLGDNGMINCVKAGTYLIDMTTSSPKLARKIYTEANMKGLYAIDAPVTGGEKGAVSGTLSIMVGGDREAYDSCYPLLSVLGTKIVYMGDAGMGQQTKLSNQIVIAGTISGVCEGMSYAMRHGLDIEKWFEIVSSGGASSRQLDNIFPKIQSYDDTPGFQIRHFIKDLKLAQAGLSDTDLKLPVLEQVIENYDELLEQGYGKSGTQGLIHQYIKG